MKDNEKLLNNTCGAATADNMINKNPEVAVSNNNLLVPSKGNEMLCIRYGRKTDVCVILKHMYMSII